MRNYLGFVVVFLSFLMNNLYAHEYHFSFAEVEFNNKCKCLQISMSVAAHDIELSLKKKGLLNGSLERNIEDNGISANLQKEFLDHFIVNIDMVNIALSIDGYEFTDDGLFYVYMSSKEISIANSSVLQFKYDLLMESFSEQQNKLTFIHNNVKQTLSFINGSQESNMILTIPKRTIND